MLLATVALALVAGVGATRIAADAGPGTLVDEDSGTSRATQEVREAFGEEPVIVLAQGDLQELILSANVFRLLRLEGCLSGSVPEGAQPIPGPCTELARLDPVEFLSGPATFLNGAVVQVDRQLRRLAQRVPPERFREFLLAIATRYGITTLPSLDNPDFVATVVFDLRRARGTPKARLSYVFPNSHSAQIAVRLRPGLGEQERERAIDLIDAAVHDTTPRRACAERGVVPAPCFQLEGGSYAVSGGPVVVDAAAENLRSALLFLIGVGVAFLLARAAGSGTPALARAFPGRRLLSLALGRPVEVLGVGLALAVLGWGLGTRLAADSGMDVSGQLEVRVRAPDLDDPATTAWMADFKERVLRADGFRGDNPSCLDTDNCPGTQEVGNQALLSFGIRAQSSQERQALIERVRAEIGEPGASGGPPPGVQVELAGLSALAAESADNLSAGRYWLTLAALAAAALALLAVYRSARRALVPLVPAVLATGWASLALWLTGVPLSPMSGALGVLTIAIVIQLAVILAARFHEERQRGRDPEPALQRAYERSGAAFLAWGVAVLAGCVVLVVSDGQMLWDFGSVMAIDLFLALLGVMLVLPAALQRSERR